MKRILLLCFGVLLTSLLAVAQWTPTVLWDQSGPGESSGFGYRILPLGDQNDDGFTDFGVLSWGVLGTTPGLPNAGKLELYHGGNPIPAAPYRRFLGEVATLLQVEDAYPAGDVNGDGYQDWTVQFWRQSENPSEHVHLFLGGPAVDTNAVAVWTIQGHDVFISLGDFNGDSFDDLYWYHGSPDYGQVFYGGSVIDTLPDWVRHGFTVPSFQQPLPQGVGDLTGDGFTDFVSERANSAYNAFIFLGATVPDTVPAYTWEAMPGDPLGIVNDLNGDAHDDLLLSDFFHNIWLFWGRDSLTRDPDRLLPLSLGGAPYELGNLGDINHDGWNDFAVCSAYSAGGGGLALYLGSPWMGTAPARIFGQGAAPLYLNSVWMAMGLGDVNGDDLNDWAIGVYGWVQRGRVVIIAGDTDLVAAADEPPPPLPQDLAVSVYPNPFNSNTTIALDVPVHIREATLTVYNLLGQAVFQTTLPVAGGSIRYRYDASSQATGLYLLRVEAGSFTSTQKLMLLK